MLVNELTGGGAMVHLANGRTEPMLENADQAVKMMVTYGLGFAAVFGLFTLLYFHAWRKRHELELSEAENLRRSVHYRAQCSAGECATAVNPGIVSRSDHRAPRATPTS